MIKEKARKLSGNPAFRAGDGWYKKLIKRNSWIKKYIRKRRADLEYENEEPPENEF